MPLVGCKEDVLQQVSHIWSMLDELCEDDPEAYRKLIEKQMREGAELNVPPEFHSCLCTEMLEPKKGLLYINLCSWKHVPAPQDLNKPLPLYAGKLETEANEGQGQYSVLDVALNPGILQECKKEETHMNQVYMLLLKFSQQQHGLKLSQQYSVVSSSPKSTMDDLYRRLGFQQWPNVGKQPDPASQTPAALLHQISSIRSERQETPAAQIICGPAEHKKKDLIQVISSTFVQPQRPEYQLEMKTDTSGAPHSMELTVELPKVFSVSECQLRISKEDVLLEVEDVYYLLLEFPHSVNEDAASAVFNKKQRKLTLKVEAL
ncbi:PIH1 domain-containing protein 2 [Sphaeramia orbicularis]|uniref:PIH1 domain-containing protein 2 n=1 Tax=Sphaeramia orbicularis TaxID=375764 RepID=A0A672ZKB2_9TELE|nr:PIH1 domain-containing protein 2 [Sphaeramia orbicularis]